MRKLSASLARGILFLVILVLLLTPLQQLTVRKSLTPPWDMTNKVGGFFNEPENSFDVMYFGSSHAYAAFCPPVIWKQTGGVRSYVLATQQQPLWATYAYLREALKTQTPRLVVVECRCMHETMAYYDDGVTYSYMDPLPFSWNKVRLAWVSATDMGGRAELLCSFFKYHGRWSDLKPQDYEYRPRELHDPWKGYVLLPLQDAAQQRPAFATEETAPLFPKCETWLRRIIELCQAREVPLVLVKTPSNLTLEQKELMNGVAAVAAEYGVPFHDFNEDYDAIGLRPQDFYDKSHLDCYGAYLFSQYFGDWLTEHCPDLPKHPEDPVWAADYAAYTEALRAELGAG